MRIIIASLAVAAVVLGGCQTGAQRQAQGITDSVAAARATYEPCYAGVEARPEFQGVLAKMPQRAGGAPTTLEMLANTERPTDAEVATLYALHQARQPCRQIGMEAIAKVHPGLVSLFAEAFAGQDQDYVRLVRRESSWGDYAQSYEARRTKLAAQLDAMTRQIEQELANAHAFELQQRQQASQALLLWSSQQQLLYQQQQYLNRPRLTNCRYQGTFLNCTTF